MRKICVITGTRAEYGLLSRLMRLVANSSDCQLQVIATNMHLLPEYGNTYQEIEADGFRIDAKVYMYKSSDDSLGIVESMAEEMSGMNKALAALRPDLVVILGDRYEMLVAAQVAMLHRIPVAHLYGGDITEGAYDDSIRHCITKLSHLHFTSTEEYRQRVIQLGEQPDRVYYVGSLGVENIRKMPLLNQSELEEWVGISFDKPIVLATYHPVTLGCRTPMEDILDFLSALDEFPHLQVIFTMPNSDQGGDLIREAILRYCANNSERCKAFPSLGVKRYLSLMRYAVAVVGNSSSGLVEVPSVHIPTLNIGDRQKGRARSLSVIDCQSDKASVVEGLKKVLSDEQFQLSRYAQNPYEKAGTAQSIFDVISTHPLESLTQKSFYNIQV